MILQIDSLPLMNSSNDLHWRVRIRERKRWEEMLGYLLAHRIPDAPWPRISLTLTRHSSVRPDYDNLVHSWKPIQDSIVKLGFVRDDSPEHVQAVYLWEKAPPKKGKVTIEMEALLDD